LVRGEAFREPALRGGRGDLVHPHVEPREFETQNSARGGQRLAAAQLTHSLRREGKLELDPALAVAVVDAAQVTFPLVGSHHPVQPGGRVAREFHHRRRFDGKQDRCHAVELGGDSLEALPLPVEGHVRVAFHVIPRVED